MAAHETLKEFRELPLPSPRSFGFVMAGFFAIVGLLPLWRGVDPQWWGLGVAMALALCATVSPQALALPNRLWFRFGLLLAKVTTPIVMGVLFYLLITPVAVVGRLLGRDPLRLRLDPKAKSYWVSREAGTEFKPEGMKYQF
jgi:hypothetical protein